MELDREMTDVRNGRTTGGALDITRLLTDQLQWHWDNQARPRLEGLTDDEYPEPVPAPVTTIAWRIGHLLVGVLGTRNAAHFGGPAVSYEDFDYPGTAAEALDLLDEYYRTWIRSVSGLDEAALAAPVGEAEGDRAQAPMAELVLHINREMIHHLAEVALLRDLYAHRADQ